MSLALAFSRKGASLAVPALGRRVLRRGFAWAPLALAARRYTADHEWIETEKGVGTVGITDYAQKALGDVVYVEVPAAGLKVAQQDTLGAVESVKAASDIYAPVSGTVVEGNSQLSGEPTLVNLKPYSDGWLCKIKLDDPSQLDALMDEAAYKAHCESS